MADRDDFWREQQRREDQRREDERREQRRVEQRREDERREEHDRLDAEYRRRIAEHDHQRLMDDVRSGDLERAFARIGVPYPGGSSRFHRDDSGASASHFDPTAQIQALAREMSEVLHTIVNDIRLGDADKHLLALMNEMVYLDKIIPLLSARLEGLARAAADIGRQRLPYDPLGLQRQVQAQRLQELDNAREAIECTLNDVRERRESLRRQMDVTNR